MLKIGDKVMCTVEAPDGNNNLHIGDTGVIRKILDDDYGVEWDRSCVGHDLGDGDVCEHGHGWWVKEFQITLVQDCDRTFQIGDRVRCIIDHPDENDHIMIGWEGVVAKLRPTAQRLDIGVRWDEKCAGHTLDGACDDEYGWWVQHNWLDSPLGRDIQEDDIATCDQLAAFLWM